jgi:two-component system, LytTR family, response regulator
MITAFVLDDEPHSVELIEIYARKIPEITIAGTSNDPREAVEKLAQMPPVDVIFLDIFIPYMTAQQFMSKLTYQPDIILTTAYTPVNRNEFGDKVIDLLYKPFTFDLFEKALQKRNTRV